MPLRRLPAPRKDVPRMVSLRDRLDQPRKGFFAFAVCDGELHVKEAVEAIGHVFYPGGLARRGPGHDFPDATALDAATVVGDDDIPRDTGDGRQGGHERRVVFIVGEGSELTPCLVVKFDPLGGQELLQRPTALEPRFVLEIRQGRRGGEMDDTDVCVGVPLEHGVNRLAEFCHVFLVDTARIGPDELVPQRARRLAELQELGETGGLGVALLAQTPERG